jgi:predicted component of type VI protein secretion system
VPWIQISANGEELDRRALSASVVIGRSPECVIVVRDILLSRSHCRIEPAGEGWKVIDLNSKNGTRVGWQDVRLHVLRDGDHLRMGRTRIVYHTGAFEPAPERVVRRSSRLVRPADPHEALTGTVTDFVLVDDEESGREDEIESYTDHPFPQPRPIDPVTVDAEPLVSAFDDVASSFWCREGDVTSAVATEVLASPRVTMRALPRLKVKAIYREIRRSSAGETDLSLQADATQLAPEAVVAVPQLSGRQGHLASVAMVLAAGLGSAIVIMSIWLLTFVP